MKCSKIFIGNWIGHNHLLLWWQRSPSVINRVSSIAGALMEHFLEGIAPLTHWYINPNKKSNKYKYSLLSWLAKALTELFLQGNIPLRHLLNGKFPLISWQRSAFNDVNDWVLAESSKSKFSEILTIIGQSTDFSMRPNVQGLK